MGGVGWGGERKSVVRRIFLCSQKVDVFPNFRRKKERKKRKNGELAELVELCVLTFTSCPGKRKQELEAEWN